MGLAERMTAYHWTGSCPACHAPFAHETMMPYCIEEWTILGCRQCGYHAVSPLPSHGAIEAHYNSDAYRQADDLHYAKSRSRKRRAMLRALRLWPWFRGRTVLDIGCGGGFMVEAFALFGARSASGIDMSRAGIAYATVQARRGTYRVADVESLLSGPERYGFVFCSEVLEHLPDATLLPRALAACVQYGGYALVNAPDIGHRETPADLTQWPALCPPEHLQWFTSDGFAAVMERHGFVRKRRLRARGAAFSDLFLRVDEKNPSLSGSGSDVLSQGDRMGLDHSLRPLQERKRHVDAL
ncbi:methyltransferase domain-containing protein [Asaia sp. As-1742]|uniref:class I SAM-dependent methyltransferase n=1 Tax=Asaia sp. As-1742 TaxID=2608325 RepID=UPI001422E497|nr:methyltransferase domain-containing protein [Asaia sp. As-1742]